MARTAALSGDGSRVAYAVGRRVVVRRVAGWPTGRRLRGCRRARALAFSPGGRRARDRHRRRVTCRFAASNRQDDARCHPVACGAVTSSAFSTAGDRIAAGAQPRGPCTVWRSSGGAPLFKWLAHRRGTRVLGVAFNRSGRLLATAGRTPRFGSGEPATVDRSPTCAGTSQLSAASPSARTDAGSCPPGRAQPASGTSRAQQRLLFLDGHKGQLLAAQRSTQRDAASRRSGSTGRSAPTPAASVAEFPSCCRLADAPARRDGTPTEAQGSARARHPPAAPSAAACSAARSSLRIFSIASMARRARSGSGSAKSSAMPVGTTCHETPKRSFSQPHWLSSPPSVSPPSSSRAPPGSRSRSRTRSPRRT